MYRRDFHVQVQLGNRREFHGRLKELNARLSAKSLVPLQPWEAAIGLFDDALMVADYVSLEAPEREHNAVHSDAACMKLWREMGKHMEGIPWTDLWWRPSKAV